MSRSVVLAIPAKGLNAAKQRLSPVLSRNDRALLAQYLLERTIHVLRSGFPCAPLLIVTPSCELATLASNAGCRVVLEPFQMGLNAAAETAARWSREHGFRSQLLIHSDIPALEATDVQAILQQPRSSPSVVAIASRDHGTNMLLTTPPEAIPFQFGKDSFAAHRAAAVARRIPFTGMCLPGIAWDVDTPEDLRELMAQETFPLMDVL